jgi:sulfofructose kinase
MAFRKVVGLGLSVLDESYLVEDFEMALPRTRFLARRVAAGGMMGTAVAQSATLGVKTQLLTLLGDDREGRAIISELRRFGVDTRRVIRSVKYPTTVAVVLVDRETRDRRFLVPDRRKIESAAPDFDLSRLDPETVLMIDGHYPAQAMRGVRHARERGAVVVADFHTPRPGYLRLLPFVDYPILPLEFGLAWHGGTPRQILFALREEFGCDPVLTLGERGALALWDGRIVEIPARRVRVRDTTGAGDVFHGAFAAGLCLGFSFFEALHLASRAAAVCCTELGGTGRLLQPKEISSRPAGRRRS